MSLRDLMRRAQATELTGDAEALCQEPSCHGPWWYCNHGQEWLPGNLVQSLAATAFDEED